MYNLEEKNKLILECINRQYVRLKHGFVSCDKKGKCFLFPRSEPLWYLVIAKSYLILRGKKERRQPQ